MRTMGYTCDTCDDACIGNHLPAGWNEIGSGHICGGCTEKIMTLAKRFGPVHFVRFVAQQLGLEY